MWDRFKVDPGLVIASNVYKLSASTCIVRIASSTLKRITMLNHGFHFITSSLGALQIQQLSLSLCLLDNLILNQKKEKKKF